MLMQLLHSHPSRSRRRLLGVALALPLLAAGFWAVATGVWGVASSEVVMVGVKV